jgi:hypothetical protein
LLNDETHIVVSLDRGQQKTLAKTRVCDGLSPNAQGQDHRRHSEDNNKQDVTNPPASSRESLFQAKVAQADD